MDKVHGQTHESKEKPRRTAEHWLQVAKDFGAKCLKIQQDSNLDLDQIYDKINVLSNEIIKEIESDKHLEKRDRDQMLESIHSYLTERQELHDVIKKTVKGEKSGKK